MIEPDIARAERPTQSENLNELAAALAKAQAEMKPAEKNRVNPFFKSSYADLESVWNACREPLSKSGLSVLQIPTVTKNGLVLRTRLLHISGQWIECSYPVSPTKPDPQSLGSAVSYARRYSLAPMVGVVTEDDDGNGGSTTTDDKNKKATQTPPNKPPQTPPPAKSDAKQSPVSSLSEKQIARLFAIAGSNGWSNTDVKNLSIEKFKKDSTKKLFRKEYDELVAWIEKNPNHNTDDSNITDDDRRAADMADGRYQ